MTSWGHTPAPARMGESATRRGELECAPKRARRKGRWEMNDHTWARLKLRRLLVALRRGIATGRTIPDAKR